MNTSESSPTGGLLNKAKSGGSLKALHKNITPKRLSLFGVVTFSCKVFLL